jgi:hypothetical protein
MTAPRSKAKMRKAMLEEIVMVQATNAEIHKLQKAGEARVARATMAAEFLGFDSIDDALATITDDEMEEARAGLLASANGKLERAE